MNGQRSTAEETGQTAEEAARARTVGKDGPAPQGLSLKKSAFWRMLAISLGTVLIFYGIGLTINRIGIWNVRNDMQAALQTQVEYAADQTDQELERLKFFAREMASDKQVLRFAISQPVLTEWERQSYVRLITAQEYLIKRASDMAESIRIMFPSFGRTIVTEQAEYIGLDQEIWNRLYAMAEKSRVTLGEWNGQLWILTPRMDAGSPMFLVAISVAPENVANRLEMLASDRTRDMVLYRQDGTVLAACGDGAALFAGAAEKESSMLMAEAAVAEASMTLRAYSRINWALAPFALYRRVLWLLTALALGLMGAYLWYARRFILRPLNALSDSMRQVEQDGRYRMNATGNPDYDDLYAQFNHMVDHLERLTGQVYEERYRAQQAELKQLQMQIDPHFLYNSLYLIYRMAQSGESREIANLSLNLSHYYRYITRMPEQVVRMRDEIGHVMNYLEIQRVRFEPRVRIEAEELPEEIADEPVPSLIIQPIVENAFQHGVRDMDSGGVVRLRYQVTETEFRVIVSDNSGRMTPERVEELWQKLLRQEEQDVSALRNLYRRLQIYEEGAQALTLECEDGGLKASVRFRRRGNAV